MRIKPNSSQSSRIDFPLKFSTEASDNHVTLCGFECEVTASTTTSLDCTIPKIVTENVLAAYEDIATVEKLSGTWSADDASIVEAAFDVETSTYYSSSSSNCYIQLELNGGLAATLNEVRYFPQINTHAPDYAGTDIEGYAGSSWETIYTLDETTHDGFNSYRDESGEAYTRFRISGSQSNGGCAFAEVEFRGIYQSTSSDAISSIDCYATVEVNGESETTSAVSVNYQDSLTGSLDSISPKLGTALGGTTLNIYISGHLPGSAGDITVYIDETECTGVTIEDAGSDPKHISCTTGSAPPVDTRKSSLKSQLSIEYAGEGKVITNGIQYLYIDRWSDLSTWGNTVPPREGDSVSIPAGQSVLVDVSPNKLNAVIVEGALVFDDSASADIHFQAHYIFVRNGRL